MSGFLNSRRSTGGAWKAPSNDIYGLWGKKKQGMFDKITVDKQVILPGVSFREGKALESIRDYVKQQTGEECTLPQHIIEDVYSMYVNEDIKRRPVTKHTAIKQKIIDRVYNSLTKEVTKNSPVFSQLVAKELAVYMQKVHKQLEEEQKKQQGGNNGDGNNESGGIDAPVPGAGEGESGDGEGEGIEQGNGPAPGEGTGMDGHGDLTQEAQDQLNKVDDILDKNENELDNRMKQASKNMQDLENQLGKEALEDLASNEPDFLDKMDGIRDALKRVTVNKDSIKEVMSKILDKSENYFSKNFHTVEESIFDAEELDDMFGLEFLNPIFRNAELMSVGNERRVYTGKIDLYLDCSGSMSSTENFEGQNIRMADLVKGIAMVLFRMGMIDKLYFFDGHLYEIKNINEFTILGFNKSGGTNFDKVVEQCLSNGRNSVVITDGEDGCEKYAKNVFWVGVGGTRFDSRWGGGRAFDQYKKAKQCVTYVSQRCKRKGFLEYC